MLVDDCTKMSCGPKHWYLYLITFNTARHEFACCYFVIYCSWISEPYLSLDVACVRPWSGAWPECSPGNWEGSLWVQDWYWIQWPGFIIHCKALWVVSHTRKAQYKNQFFIIIILSFVCINLCVCKTKYCKLKIKQTYSNFIYGKFIKQLII